MLRHANLETRACFRRIQDLSASKNFDLNFNVELVKKKKKIERERAQRAQVTHFLVFLHQLL